MSQAGSAPYFRREEASTNEMSGGPFLNAEQIRAATFIRHVELHESLDSTNNRALELARDERAELPALVVARRQTAGRGRGERTWWAAEGALTFSVFLEPSRRSSPSNGHTT
jgi:hypothetical protein